MTRQKFIRELYYVNGKNITEISRDSGHDRKTVRAIVGREDWNAEIGGDKRERATPKLEPYKATIDEWLTEDKRTKRPQRHTAKRVYDRLRTEKETKDRFDCSYETVNAYVQKRKKEIFSTQSDGYIPLDHRPGEAQCDFGSADYYENGTLVEGRHLNLAFPHSNQGYPQVCPGENAECLLEGLASIFNHIGGVPPEIWFDNASTMVAHIGKSGLRELTEKFIRFKEHYGFTAIFCNPYSGHEKGSVEGKVGYHRRNMLVPVPRFKDLGEYNRRLLELADADGAREHYRKGSPITELFEKDKSALIPLPRNEFDTSRHETARVDKYGFVHLGDGKHEYSTSPKFAGGTVTLKLTSATVTAFDGAGNQIVAHRRLYGDKKQRSMNWAPYLELLARRPRAVKYCGIYEMFPSIVKDYLDASRPGDVSGMIRMIAEITKSTGFESAVATVAQAATRNVADPDSLKALHRRLYMDVPELPPLPPGAAPYLEPLMPDLSKYDMAIGRGRVQ